MGSMPMIIASAVISTGRMRVYAGRKRGFHLILAFQRVRRWRK